MQSSLRKNSSPKKLRKRAEVTAAEVKKNSRSRQKIQFSERLQSFGAAAIWKRADLL